MARARRRHLVQRPDTHCSWAAEEVFGPCLFAPKIHWSVFEARNMWENPRDRTAAQFAVGPPSRSLALCAQCRAPRSLRRPCSSSASSRPSGAPGPKSRNRHQHRMCTYALLHDIFIRTPYTTLHAVLASGQSDPPATPSQDSASQGGVGCVQSLKSGEQGSARPPQSVGEEKSKQQEHNKAKTPGFDEPYCPSP